MLLCILSVPELPTIQCFAHLPSQWQRLEKEQIKCGIKALLEWSSGNVGYVLIGWERLDLKGRINPVLFAKRAVIQCRKCWRRMWQWCTLALFSPSVWKEFCLWRCRLLRTRPAKEGSLTLRNSFCFCLPSIKSVFRLTWDQQLLQMSLFQRRWEDRVLLMHKCSTSYVLGNFSPCSKWMWQTSI